MASIRKNQATSRRPRPSRHRVAVLVRHGVMPMELGVVHQMFRAARGRDGSRLYDVLTCTPSPGRVRTDADFAVQVSRGPRTLARADTVVIPASHESDEKSSLAPAVADALAGVRQPARVASICTGAFVLAAAGLLDGRRATTHWKSADRFRALFPDVDLDPAVLYTDDDGVLTSAGEASGIDLCLYMIREDHGAAVANDVARTTVVPPHRDGGQAQFITAAVPAPDRASTGAARTWALRHLDRALTLQDLADHSAMSVRTLTRRFQAEVGMTPLQWLTQQRLRRARELLEQSSLPVDDVASRAGFGTGTSLRHHFRVATGVSPRAYRTTFQASR